jgi:fructose 1,6-bisphosphatase
VTLQWATYYDAADMAGQSRLYGGIHIVADDFNGRKTGSACGTAALALALRYYAGQTGG